MRKGVTVLVTTHFMEEAEYCDRVALMYRAEVIALSLGISDSARLAKEEQQENQRLRLEVASLKTPSRIERLAKGELGMALPTDQQVVVVK